MSVDAMAPTDPSLRAPLPCLKYDVLVVQGKTKLIFPVKDDNVVPYYVPNSSKKGVVVKPIISSDFNSRCQVDLIDFQSHPDEKFK
ncbi:KRAB-A domain-containing protein 2-like [Aphis craccivora]|uniref:KRAB-A domain-containing protein 2-like n=1 Tax=Aphis craccivora TaxID=307492 RepID=A0A6G0Y3K1_APHCR|nr:KRAB-A domain-containing protein 2-like [Aphis craccivora]